MVKWRQLTVFAFVWLVTGVSSVWAVSNADARTPSLLIPTLTFPWAAGDPHGWTGGPHGVLKVKGKIYDCQPNKPPLCTSPVPIRDRSGLDFGAGGGDWIAHPIAPGKLIWKGALPGSFGAGAVVETGALDVLYGHMNLADVLSRAPAIGSNVTTTTALGLTNCTGLCDPNNPATGHHLHVDLQVGIKAPSRPTGVPTLGTVVSWDGKAIDGWNISAQGFGNYDGSATNGCGTTVLADATHPPIFVADRSSCPTSAAAGGFNTCTLTGYENGHCWGDDANRQLADGSTADSAVPVPLGISPAVQLAVGRGHACALLTDATVLCWGRDDLGQVGKGSMDSWSPPAQVVSATGAGTLAGVTSISAGAFHTCALLGTGDVVCWGFNEFGQIGSATLTSSSVPIAVDIAGASGLAAGGEHSCAIVSGHVRCWGTNAFGDLGDGSTTGSATPVEVTGVSTAAGVSAGGSHTCARLSDDSLRCWGSNSKGQLGDGVPSHTLCGFTDCSPAPVKVTGIATASAVSAGGEHSCAIDAGSIKCWGFDAYGQLGARSTVDTNVPVPVLLSGTPVSLASGDDHSCAVLSTGATWCWGLNNHGQVGDGTFIDRTAPVLVVSPTP